MFTNTYYGWNNSCYKDKRVRTIVADIQNLTEKDYEYDCIIIDLLDPDSSNQKNNQLWLDILTTAKKWLAPGGSIAKTWSRDYNNSVPHRSVNLNTYLPN